MNDPSKRHLDPSLSSMFKDISNLKTPRNTKYDTVSSSPFSQSKYHTPPLSSSRLRSKAARKLKAFELEQTKSARKAQTLKEKSLKSLAKSLTVWLNFLFESPRSCGCEVEGNSGREVKGNGNGNGKRESECGRDVVRVEEGMWRGPKRQRGGGWKGKEEGEMFSDVKFSGLRGSLKEICSFDDLEERMRVYLSLGSCKEIFQTMSVAAKACVMCCD